MPIQVNYMENGKGVELIGSGVVTGEEIIRACEESYGEEHLAGQRYRIIDRTTCTEYRVTAEEIQTITEIGRRASETNPNIVIAVVAPNALLFGFSRMWQNYMDGCPFVTEIFDDRASADAWIAKQLGKR